MSRRAYDKTGTGAEGECEARVIDSVAVERALRSLPGGDDLGAMADIFGALSDPTRLRLLAALANGPLCVCDLAEVAGVSQSAVSHQLRLLRSLRLVEFSRDGKRAVYRLADAHVATLLSQGREHAAERRGH